MSGRAKHFRILSEKVVQRPGQSTEENPYWLDEEPEPHPDPSAGCVRRGVCCRTSPGWFGPGEVEKAAALKEMEPDAFVRSYLIVDGMEVDGDWVHVFAPVKLDRFGKPALPPASQVDGLYRALRGSCIFYTGEGCDIYAARPMECSGYVCTKAPEEQPRHEDIARQWKADSSH